MLRAEGVGHSFGGAAVLQNLDLTIISGSRWIISGPSGRGKTTLLKILAGLLPPTSGRCWCPLGWTQPSLAAADDSQTDIYKLSATQRRTFARSVQYIAQEPERTLDPRWTAEACAAEGLLVGQDRVSPEVVHRKVTKAFVDFGLKESLLAARSSTLSGGERRRVAIIRSLLVAPKVLLLDEPTAGLDQPASIAALSALDRSASELGTALVLVTHQSALTVAFDAQEVVL